MVLRRNKFLALVFCVKDTAIHLLKRLWHSPVLLGYLVVGTIVAIFQDGIRELIVTALNLIILGAFAILIRMMTSKRPVKTLPVHRPKIELIAGLGLFLLLLGSLFLFWNLTEIPILQAGFNQFKLQVGGHAVNFLYSQGFPSWINESAGTASVTIIIEVIPILLLFFFCGYGPRGMGLRPRYWKLTITLLIVTPLLSLLIHKSAALFQESLLKTLTLFLIQLFINGFPEELFFRGFLLPRFEHIVKNPANALVITSLFFMAFHIPSYIGQGSSIPDALLTVVNVSFPSGLLWGYLYQRTRSVIPGMLFHTSYSLLGAYFFN